MALVCSPCPVRRRGELGGEDGVREGGEGGR